MRFLRGGLRFMAGLLFRSRGTQVLHAREEVQILFDTAAGEADPGPETIVSLGEFEDAGAVGFQIVIDGVAAAETPVDEEELLPKHDEIAVVVVTGDDSLDITHLAHRDIESRVEFRGSGLFAEVALHDAGSIPDGLGIFGERDMEEGKRRDRLAAAAGGEGPARRPVPLDLVRMDISPALYPGGILPVSGVEEIEDPFDAVLAGQGQDIVGTTVDAQVVRGVDVPGDGPEHLVHLGPGEVEIAVVVAHGDREGNVPVDERLQDGPGGRLRRLPEDDIPGMDDEVRLLRIQHFFDVAERPLGTWVACNIVSIRQLQDFDLAVFPIFQVAGHPDSLRFLFSGGRFKRGDPDHRSGKGNRRRILQKLSPVHVSLCFNSGIHDKNTKSFDFSYYIYHDKI